MSFITELLFFQEGHITLLFLVGTTVLLSCYVQERAPAPCVMSLMLQLSVHRFLVSSSKIDYRGMYVCMYIKDLFLKFIFVLIKHLSPLDC